MKERKQLEAVVPLKMGLPENRRPQVTAEDCRMDCRRPQETTEELNIKCDATFYVTLANMSKQT